MSYPMDLSHYSVGAVQIDACRKKNNNRLFSPILTFFIHYDIFAGAKR
jgi:hypothetical protein